VANGASTKVRTLHSQLTIVTRANGDKVDYILFIKPSAEVELNVNPNEVQAVRYASPADLKAMFEDKSLKFTPWFKLICESMLFEWWEHLDSGLEKYLNEEQIRKML